MVATDRPSVLNEDCTHPVAKHRHGTLGSYISDRCRCDECRTANAAYCYRYRQGPSEVEAWLGGYTEPGSSEWLREMRAGLKQAVEESFKRHGRIS